MLVIAGLGESAGAVPPPSGLRPIAIEELPTACRDLAVTPASAAIPDPDLDAHVSVANCMAMAAMQTVTVHADLASTQALEQAMSASIAILDDVIAKAPARWQKLADAAKADLYRGMVVHMRTTAADARGRAALEPRLTSWLDTATRTEQAAAAIVEAPTSG